MPQCISNWNPNDLLLSGGWAGPFGGFQAKNLQCLLGSSFSCVTCVPKFTQKNPPIWAEMLHIWGGSRYIYIYYNKRPTEICESSILSDKASSSAPLSIQGRWAMHTWTTTAYRSDTAMFHPPPRGGRKKRQETIDRSKWVNKQMGGRWHITLQKAVYKWHPSITLINPKSWGWMEDDFPLQFLWFLGSSH